MSRNLSVLGRVIPCVIVVALSICVQAEGANFIQFIQPKGAPAIPGDSKVKGLEAFVVAQDVRFGVRSDLVEGGTAGGGIPSPVRFDQIQIAMELDNASMALLQACSQRGSYGRVRLLNAAFAREGQIQHVLDTMLYQVNITSVEINQSEDDRPTVTVTLAFTAYQMTNPTAGSGALKTAVWNAASQNKQLPK